MSAPIFEDTFMYRVFFLMQNSMFLDLGKYK